MIRLTALLLVGLSLFACSSSKAEPDQVLHLRGIDITAENYVAFVRSLRADNILGFTVLCNDIADLSDEATINYLTADPDADVTVPPGATAVSGQQAVHDSSLAAIKILRAECDR